MSEFPWSACLAEFVYFVLIPWSCQCCARAGVTSSLISMHWISGPELNQGFVGSLDHFSSMNQMSSNSGFLGFLNLFDQLSMTHPPFQSRCITYSSSFNFLSSVGLAKLVKMPQLAIPNRWWTNLKWLHTWAPLASRAEQVNWAYPYSIEYYAYVDLNMWITWFVEQLEMTPIK